MQNHKILWSLLVVAMVLVTAHGAMATYPGGFLHGYKFDSDGRDVNGTANLTNIGGVAFTGGSHLYYGNAAGPFGAGQVLSAYSNLDISGSTLSGFFTVSLWVKPSSLPASATQVFLFFHETTLGGNKANALFLYNISGQQQIVANCGAAAGNVEYNVSLSLNDWHSLALVKDDTLTCLLYVDGILAATNPAGPAGDGYDYVDFGAYDFLQPSPILGFDGQLDSVYVYDRGLNASEILDINNSNGEFDVIPHVYNVYVNDSLMGYSLTGATFTIGGSSNITDKNGFSTVTLNSENYNASYNITMNGYVTATGSMSSGTTTFYLVPASTLVTGVTVFTPYIVDSFDRPDNETVGNGWSQSQSLGNVTITDNRLNFSTSGASADVKLYRTINYTQFNYLSFSIERQPTSNPSNSGLGIYWRSGLAGPVLYYQDFTDNNDVRAYVGSPGNFQTIGNITVFAPHLIEYYFNKTTNNTVDLYIDGVFNQTTYASSGGVDFNTIDTFLDQFGSASAGTEMIDNILLGNFTPPPLFAGVPNVTSPTSNQIVRGTSVNVTLGSRESNERINVLVNTVNVVANNTNTSMLSFVVDVPVGNVNVTVRSDDVSGSGGVSSVIVPIRVSNLGTVSNVVMSKSAYWVPTESPVVNFSLSSFDGYVRPTVRLRLKNGTVVSEYSVNIPVVTIGPLGTQVNNINLLQWGQTFIAEGDTISALDSQSDNGAGYEIRQGHGYLGTLVASGSLPSSFVGVHLIPGQEYTFMTNVSGSTYSTGYVFNQYSGGNLLAGGIDYAGLDSSSFMIAFESHANFSIVFPSSIVQSYSAATFEVVVNDTLFQETNESSTVALDAMLQPYVIAPVAGSQVNGQFAVAVSRASGGLSSPIYAVESNMTGSWVVLNISNVASAPVTPVDVVSNWNPQYGGGGNEFCHMTFHLSEPLLIHSFYVIVQQNAPPSSGTLLVDGAIYNYVNNVAMIEKIFNAGDHTFDFGTNSYHSTATSPADSRFVWTSYCNNKVGGVSQVNYSTLGDLVNLTVDPGQIEEAFNVRVKANDSYVVSNYSTSGQLQLVLNPQLSSQICAALTYPNEEDLPVQAVVPVNFSVLAPLGFSSPVTDVRMVLGGTTSTNGACSYVQVDSMHRNYSCNVSMHYYYSAGSYGLNVTYTDGVRVVNAYQSGVCTYGSLMASVQSGSVVSFPTASPGISNAQSTPAIVIRNTGNTPLLISVLGYSLTGRSQSSVKLDANSFKVGPTFGSSVTLSDAVETNVTTLNSGLGSNTSLYFWLSMPANQMVQDYFSASPWLIVRTG